MTLTPHLLNYYLIFDRYGTRPADPSWGAAFPQLVWALYHYYGDLVTAKALYPSVMAYVQFMLSTIPSSGIGNMYGYYGDWVPPPPQPKVSISFTSAFSFLLNVKQTLELAQALGQQNDIATLTSIFTTQSASFNKAFFNGQSYSSGLQITYVLPLYLGIVPADSYDTVVANFLNQFVGSDHTHITAGIIGTKFLLPVLSLVNRSDLALEVVQQTDYPSWGFIVYNTLEPATTIWELWNAQSGSAGMDSRNHHMFSSVSGWMMTDMVGLTLPRHGGERGFKELEFHPARYLDLSDASVSFQHPKPVHFSWRRDGGVQCAKAPESPQGLRVSWQTRWMVVSVQCRSGDEVLGDDFKFSSITVNVSVPVGSVGVVYMYLPAHGGGVRGLQGGEWVSELDAIKLNVLPGRYSFTVKGQSPLERRVSVLAMLLGAVRLVVGGALWNDYVWDRRPAKCMKVLLGALPVPQSRERGGWWWNTRATGDQQLPSQKTTFLNEC
eukprot:Em0001g2630a